MENDLIKRAVQGCFRNVKSGNAKANNEGYQILKEDIYGVIKGRDVIYNEMGLAIYLRGKSCKYGNPFKFSDSQILKEIGGTRWKIRTFRKNLQIKGLLRFKVGKGRNWTEYTMLDSVMVPKYSKFTKQKTGVTFEGLRN